MQILRDTQFVTLAPPLFLLCQLLADFSVVVSELNQDGQWDV